MGILITHTITFQIIKYAGMESQKKEFLMLVKKIQGTIQLIDVPVVVNAIEGIRMKF